MRDVIYLTPADLARSYPHLAPDWCKPMPTAAEIAELAAEHAREMDAAKNEAESRRGPGRRPSAKARIRAATRKAGGDRRANRLAARGY